jgi:hypothetical protein
MLLRAISALPFSTCFFHSHFWPHMGGNLPVAHQEPPVHAKQSLTTREYMSYRVNDGLSRIPLWDIYKSSNL